MRCNRIHRKVFLAWNRWCAVQLVFKWEIALGVALHWERPMLDIYLGPLTLAFGNMPVLTNMHERLRSRCRGFIIAGSPDEALL
ncbi:MAG TPA: hypothetical protein VFB99_08850 [Vicinamibacterales bacterium]|nr:hypothetical protein [Vicinamibacterales bacterium]